MIDRVLNVLSVFTLVMTVPQVIAVWKGSASGVSLLSWASYLLAAILWFIHGVRLHDKSIYLACIGWMLLDAAVVAGVIMRS
jgi:uncharacterized protein with PQ loop repeat